MCQNGLTAASARMASQYSSLLVRVAPAIYALAGRPPTQDEIATARERAWEKGASSFLGSESRPDGTLIVRYGLERLGRNQVPAMKGLVANGIWSVVDDAGVEHTVQMNGFYLTGARRLAIAALREGAKELVLVIDPVARRIRRVRAQR
jgi:hypothetical protein